MKVVYITGTPRSGSTVLNVVLGDHSEVHAFGELCGFAHDWVKNKDCSCGLPAHDCPFWSAAHASWVQAVGHDPVHRYVALAERWERLSHAPRLAYESRHPSDDLEELLAYSGALLGALTTTSGASVLVDSSKGPARAYLLSMLPGVELYVLHLVRDPRGVAWSMMKGTDASRGTWHAAPVWKSAAYWSFYNACAELALARVPTERVLRLRYEQLVDRPAETIGVVGTWLDLDTAELETRLAEGGAFAVHHQLTGNRMRKAGKIELKPDTAWRTGLGRGQRWTISAMVGLHMRRYGYSPRLAGVGAPD